jgi:hypothetical protein
VHKTDISVSSSRRRKAMKDLTVKEAGKLLKLAHNLVHELRDELPGFGHESEGADILIAAVFTRLKLTNTSKPS